MALSKLSFDYAYVTRGCVFIKGRMHSIRMSKICNARIVEIIRTGVLEVYIQSIYMNLSRANSLVEQMSSLHRDIFITFADVIHGRRYGHKKYIVYPGFHRPQIIISHRIYYCVRDHIFHV